jgi:hypothetical protein
MKIFLTLTFYLGALHASLGSEPHQLQTTIYGTAISVMANSIFVAKTWNV